MNALISATPYRIDKAGENKANTTCLHYDVVKSHNAGFPAMLGQVMEWLKKTRGLEKLKTRNDVDHIDLDIGVSMGKETISSSYTIPPDFIQIANGYGLSVTISVYKQENAGL